MSMASEMENMRSDMLICLPLILDFMIAPISWFLLASEYGEIHSNPFLKERGNYQLHKLTAIHFKIN